MCANLIFVVLCRCACVWSVIFFTYVCNILHIPMGRDEIDLGEFPSGGELLLWCVLWCRLTGATSNITPRVDYCFTYHLSWTRVSSYEFTLRICIRRVFNKPFFFNQDFLSAKTTAFTYMWKQSFTLRLIIYLWVATKFISENSYPDARRISPADLRLSWLVYCVPPIIATSALAPHFFCFLRITCFTPVSDDEVDLSELLAG